MSDYDKRTRSLLRGGLYSGMAQLHLADASYVERWLGRADEVSDEEFDTACAEIHQRLVAAGHLRADEDPMERLLRQGK